MGIFRIIYIYRHKQKTWPHSKLLYNNHNHYPMQEWKHSSSSMDPGRRSIYTAIGVPSTLFSLDHSKRPKPKPVEGGGPDSVNVTVYDLLSFWLKLNYDFDSRWNIQSNWYLVCSCGPNISKSPSVFNNKRCIVVCCFIHQSNTLCAAASPHLYFLLSTPSNHRQVLD